MFRSELEEVRTMLGTKKGGSTPPAITLLPISPAIPPRPHDRPDSAHLTGPRIRTHQPAALEPDVADFIALGSFIHAGFGSMVAGDATARGRIIVDATRARGSRCLIATGLGGVDVPRDHVGDDVLVIRSVPHSEVLPRATAAVHHGGIGTVHAAMAAAAPSVIVPCIADQPYWGCRLHGAGLTPSPIPRRTLTTRARLAALDEVERYRSRTAAVAHAVSFEDEAGTALALLTSLRQN